MEPRSLTDSLRHLFTHVLFAGEPAAETRVRHLSLLIVLLLPAAILYPTLGFHLLEPDEGRYAQIPKEMLLHNSWVVPTLQGEPYLDKPPLLYWLVALSYRAFGITPEAARLVPGDVRSPDNPRGLSHRPAEHRRARRVLGGAPAERRAGIRLGRATASARRPTDALRHALGAVRLRGCADGTIEARLVDRVGARIRPRVPDEGTDLGSAAVRAVVGVWVFGERGASVPRVDEHLAITFARTRGADAPRSPAGPLVRPLLRHRRRSERAVVCRDVSRAAAVPRALLLATQRHAVPAAVRSPAADLVLRADSRRGFTAGDDSLGRVPAQLAWRASGRKPDVLRIHVGLTPRRSPRPSQPSPAGGFWLLAGLWCVFFFSCSGSKLPTYILPAYPFLCLAIGEFVARTRWNSASRRVR